MLYPYHALSSTLSRACEVEINFAFQPIEHNEPSALEDYVGVSFEYPYLQARLVVVRVD